MSALRHPKRFPAGRRAVLAAVVGALVVGVPVAWASDLFTDVPDSNPFHADITAVKQAGITAGKTCVPPGTPPTYCPGESITREAMAAFVYRGFGRAVGAKGAPQALTGATVDLAVLTVNLGGVPGEKQFVKVDAALHFSTASVSGCPCTSRFRVVVDGGQTSRWLYATNGTASVAGASHEPGSFSGVFLLASGASYTVRLQASRWPAAGFTGTVTGQADVTAITAPFGSTGGNTLG